MVPIIVKKMSNIEFHILSMVSNHPEFSISSYTTPRRKLIKIDQYPIYNDVNEIKIPKEKCTIDQRLIQVLSSNDINAGY